MFLDVDPWEVALWVVAAYVATVALVRLMIAHRDRLIARFREQVQIERRRQTQMILARKRRAAAAARPEVPSPHGPLETSPLTPRHD